MSKYLKTVNGNKVSQWKSKGISNYVLKTYTDPAPQASQPKRNMYLEFSGGCLSQV